MKRVLIATLVTMSVASAAAIGMAQTALPGPGIMPASPGPAAAQAAPVTATVGGDIKREMADVPVRRVVLFSSGVGFFQHAGTVTGNAATELRFKTDQINDILKSLVVSDTVGVVKSITYGSQNPVSRTLKSFQIDISANPTLADILNQIRGSKVTLALADESVEGTILGVEQKQRPIGPSSKPDDQKVVMVSFVNIITSAGIRSVQLDDVKKLQLEDDALQKELDQALAALAQARDKDKKPVIVNFDGTGVRPVGIAYLVETPVWKTSYRLILPDSTSRDNASLLGWAIVENQTDNDWNNVTLDLVGGRPISFIQNLYQPLYVPRPTVQPKTYASLTPQTYEEGMDTSGAGGIGGVNGQSTQLRTAAPGAAGRGGGGRGGAGGGGFGGGGIGGGVAPQAAAAPMMAESFAKQADDLQSQDFTQGVRSIADATKLGESFQYSVKGVTLPRQRSSMIPIISEAVPFDRVSIYNRGVLARNALSGVRLKNQTKDYLLAGPLTVLDNVKRADGNQVQGYAGDATIDDVPPGQERLLSYAVDQELQVDSNKREGGTHLVTGSIVKGVLHLRYTDSISQQYGIENKGDSAKNVVIEDPLDQGYDLKDPPKSLEKTDKVYRFAVAAPAKKTVTFDVLKEKVRMDELAILPMDTNVMEFYRSNQAIPAKVKDALQMAADKRRAVADAERKLQLRVADSNRISNSEANIRENIKVLPVNSKSQQDAITDLAAKDKELKQADSDIKDLQVWVEKSRADLEGYLADLSVE